MVYWAAPRLSDPATWTVGSATDLGHVGDGFLSRFEWDGGAADVKFGFPKKPYDVSDARFLVDAAGMAGHDFDFSRLLCSYDKAELIAFRDAENRLPEIKRTAHQMRALS